MRLDTTPPAPCGSGVGSEERPKLQRKSYSIYCHSTNTFVFDQGTPEFQDLGKASCKQP